MGVSIQQIYGTIIVLMYALVATVVLANLLIALISYHFQPEKTEAQSKFQMAEILAHYEYMIDHHLIGAPFSLPQVCLCVDAMYPCEIASHVRVLVAV